VSTIFISNGLCPPYDEGGKIFAKELAGYIHENQLGFSVSNHYEDDGVGIKKVSFSKSIVSWGLLSFLWRNKCQKIILLPQSPLTFWAFLKAFVLRVVTLTPVSLIGLQPWKHSGWQKLLLRAMCSVQPWVQSKRNQNYLSSLGFDSGFLPPGVNKEKFCSVGAERKCELRRKYNVPQDKRVVLHVGHVRTSRNLEWLIRFVEEDYHVLMIGSTYRNTAFGTEEDLLEERLRMSGVDLRTEFCSEIEHYYQISDLYLFPVQDALGAIELPLSVFEALSCEIPVVSTRFGGLDSRLANHGLCFAESCDDAVNKAAQFFVKGREAICFPAFSWEHVFAELFEKKILPRGDNA